MAITADRIIAGVKRRVTLPTSSTLQGENDILAFADDVISSRIVPLIEGIDEDFFVHTQKIPLRPGVTDYKVPYRAIGRGLKSVRVGGPDGRDIRRLNFIDDDEDVNYNPGTGDAEGFYFISDRIRVTPVPHANVSDDLYITYRLAPSRLVKESDVSKVVALINVNQVLVDKVPGSFDQGSLVDFIEARSGNTIYEMDVPLTGYGGTTLTFADNPVPGDLEVGDYIAPAGTSPVVSFVPNEVYSLIETLTAHRLLVSIGDFEGARFLAEEIATEEKNIRQILEPRLDGAGTIIVNKYGLVRGGRGFRRGWYGVR